MVQKEWAKAQSELDRRGSKEKDADKEWGEFRGL